MTDTKPANKFENVKTGMRIRVWQIVKEGDKERPQAFEGLVIARKHGAEPGATVTVRSVRESIGVEKIYPIFLPSVQKVEVLSRHKVRRAKLYFVRKLPAKKIQKKLKPLA